MVIFNNNNKKKGLVSAGVLLVESWDRYAPLEIRTPVEIVA